MSSTQAWTLRETLIVTVLGAVFAVLYLGWVQVWLIAQAVFGPVTMDVVMGFWFIASMVAAAIIRKPGVAFAAEVLTRCLSIATFSSSAESATASSAAVKVRHARPRPCGGSGRASASTLRRARRADAGRGWSAPSRAAPARRLLPPSRSR